MAIDFITTTKPPDEVALLGVPVCSGDLESVVDIDLAFLAERGFEGKVGETLALPGNDGATVVAVGLGRRDEVGPDAFRKAGAALARAAWRSTAITTSLLDVVDDDGDRVACTRALAEGIGLGSYRFCRHKTDQARCSIESATIVTKGGKRVAQAAEIGGMVANAVAFARDLVNEPAGTMTPRDLAEAAIAVAERDNLAISVLDEVDIEAAGLGGIMGVAAGSLEPARMIQITYEPPKPRGTLALVGKGVTFDSGGLSIKPSNAMIQMKTDMSGAAAVLATMSVLRALEPKVRVIGLVPAAENMPSGSAIRPGDVVKIRNGTTVEVLNTDAEGRLLLADALSLAVEEEPDAIVDVATLTGACVVALGPRIAGLMGNHQGLIDMVAAAADRGGEPVWPLPLPADYRNMIDGEIADIRNHVPDGKGGTLTAGLFLKEFVGDVPWAHLDIAGPARSEEERGVDPVGGTGFGVRTLVSLVETFRKPKPSEA